MPKTYPGLFFEFFKKISYTSSCLYCQNFVSKLRSAASDETFSSFLYFKDTHKEKASSNKTPALKKGTNMGVWTIGASNQLFIRGS